MGPASSNNDVHPQTYLIQGAALTERGRAVARDYILTAAAVVA